ncbi:hypothetical protein ACFP3Q_08535 [Nocardioides sp. GCM10027113]|uniref:hypothetical protein n=1 Tax=unclassified Nocardioides TaxID=2615069 RepID=UPI003619D96F
MPQPQSPPSDLPRGRSRSRARLIAVGALAVTLAAAPLLPRGGPEPAIVPSGDRAAPAAPGTVTPEMRAEIEAVVGDGLAAGRLPARPTVDALAERLVRCADLGPERYCLHTGFTTATETVAQDRVAATARVEAARPAAQESTGELTTLAALRRTAGLDPAERADRERRELLAAARAVGKVAELRQAVGADASTASTARAARTKRFRDYPRRSTVLRPKRVREQVRSYWCGPATMQMIAWGWQDRPKPQRHWSRKLGTTTNGSSVWDMVRVINAATGYDRDAYAGDYVVLDISDWTYRQWLLLNMRHIADYRAPLVLHPMLHKRFFPYLDDDASGHFQVGRGYDKRGDKPAHVGYFEPWNQQRFDPSEPYIARVQWRSAYRSYRANLAHPQQNIGV